MTQGEKKKAAFRIFRKGIGAAFQFGEKEELGRRGEGRLRSRRVPEPALTGERPSFSRQGVGKRDTVALGRGRRGFAVAERKDNSQHVSG